MDVVWCEEDPEVPSYFFNVSACSRDQPRIALYDARTLEGSCFRMFWYFSGEYSSAVVARMGERRFGEGSRKNVTLNGLEEGGGERGGEGGERERVKEKGHVKRFGRGQRLTPFPNRLT